MNYDDQDWEPPSEADMKLISARRERADQISKLMAGYLLKGYKMLGSLCEKCDTILLQDKQGVNHCVACTELDSDTAKDNPATNESAAISMARELEMASASGNVSLSSADVSGASSSVRQASAITKSSGQASTSAALFPSHWEDRIESKPKSSIENVTSNLSISSVDVQSFTTNAITNGTDPGLQNQLSTIPKPQAEKGLKFPSRVGDETSGLSGNLSHENHNVSSTDSDSAMVYSIHRKISWASKELENTANLEYSIQLCQFIRVASEAIVALRNARL